MRLIRAELLKIRRRQATYVILIVDLVLLGAFLFLAAPALGGFGGIIEFPNIYGVIGEFVWGVGGLMALVYTAAMVGSDWNWGVIRNVVARGESRANYLLAKAAGLAIALGIAMLVVFAVGIVLVFIVGAIHGIPVASPLRGRGLQDLVDYLVLGYPVLLERAVIGFVVAVLLRSQIAGALVGVILYAGEAILTTTFTFFTFISRAGESFGGGAGLEPIGPEWFQFLPISIGGQVLNAAPGGLAAGASGGLSQFLLRTVAPEVALSVLIAYLVASLAVAIVALNRQEIT